MHRLLAIGATAVLAMVLCGPAGAWSWPAEGAVLRPFSLGGDVYAAGQHRGVDIAGPEGSPIRAPASGTVTFAGSLPTYGRGVTILTGDGYAVTLVHLGTIEVAKGASVAEGDAVGTMGWSGTPEHPVPTVHLGIRRADDDEGYVDPLGLLPARTDATAPPAAAQAASPAPVPVPAPTTTPAPTAPAAGALPPPPSPSPVSPSQPSASSPAPAPGPPASAPAVTAPSPVSAPAVSTDSPGSSAPPASSAAGQPGLETSAPVDSVAGDAGALGRTASSAAVEARKSGDRPRSDVSPEPGVMRAPAAGADVIASPAYGAVVQTRVEHPDVAARRVEGALGRQRSTGSPTSAPTPPEGAVPRPYSGIDERVAGRSSEAPVRAVTSPGARSAAPGGQPRIALRAPSAEVVAAALGADDARGRDGGAPLGPLVAAFALGCLVAVAVVGKAARRIDRNGALLRHDADLLRELDPAHRARVHDGRSGHRGAPSAAARA